ncbi:MAG: Fpg/Nei family DNA glycosylase [Nakamurella sp.]
MPEGHTLHRLAAEYNEHFRGRVTESSSPQGRFTVEAAKIDGRVMADADAYGKHLFLEFGEHTVHVHLGLAGKIAFTGGRLPEVVGAVRWRLTSTESDTEAERENNQRAREVGSAEPDNNQTAREVGSAEPDNNQKTREGGWTADLRGPAACELVTPGEVDALLARLGPDPLRADADPELAWQQVSRSRVPIAALLMDQRIAAGVGNIYRAELLYRHRVDPMMPGRLMKHREWQTMWEDLVGLMNIGVRTGRIDTVRPEHEPESMGREPRADRHGGEVYVYRRAGQRCLVCGSMVRTLELAGRNLFWCPGCQRRTRRTAR